MRFRGLGTANIVGNLGATLMPSARSAELESVQFDALRSIDERYSRSEAIQPECTTGSEAADVYDAWDVEDEVPEYCDDPFTLGMRTAISNSMAKLAKPSSHDLTGGLVDYTGLEDAAARNREIRSTVD